MKTEVADKQGGDIKRVNEKIGFDKTKASGHNKKVFEIQVKRCINLRRADATFNSAAFNPKLMQPFFSFDFYTFEFQSAVSDGPNAVFEMTQRYEMEYTQELVDYMRTQFLKIDFIDESVALST